MATNINYDAAKKTTKLVRGIHSWIKFQKHQGVESLTIQGKDTLADVSQDKNGDTNLILMADVDKVNSVASNVPYLGISHTITGEDPDKNKTANISQDLTQFPLSGGELVTVTKETDGLTIHDEKVTEFVNTTLSAKETELKEFVNTTLSAKETELKNYIDSHATGGQGVTPDYVDNEIKKVKEELTAKINAGSGSSNQNENIHKIYWAKASTYYANSAKYVIPGVSNRSLISISLDYYVDNQTHIEQLFIPAGDITDYVKNGIRVECSNASDGNELTITLPKKVDSFTVNLISYSYPFGEITDVNATITPDPSYEPPAQ